MKNISIITLTVLIFSLLFSAFTTSENHVLPSSFSKDFVKEINNEQLNQDLANNFSSLLDAVSKVSAYDNEEMGAFYLVEGQKDGANTFFTLKTTQHEVDTESYHYIEFDSLVKKGIDTESAAVIYCRYNRTKTRCSHLYSPLNPICGIKSNGKCVMW